MCREVLQVWRLELISLADAPRILSLRSFQVAAIRTGGDSPGRRLVFALLAFVPRRRGIARWIGACTPIMSPSGGGCRVTPRKWNAVCARELKPTNESWRVDSDLHTSQGEVA